MAELFADLLGQPLAVRLLEAALRQGRLAPAYLFSGPEGVGRRLAALRFLEGVLAATDPGATALRASTAPIPALSTDAATAAFASSGPGASTVSAAVQAPVPAAAGSLRRRLQQGNHPDLLWVEPTYSHQGRLVPLSQAESEGVPRRAAPQLRLEQVREVTAFLTRRPVEGGRCLVVLDGAEAMAEAAANALLKTLEEPGEGLLILICAAPEQLLSTIRSRCQTIPFRRLSPALVDQVLGSLAESGALRPAGAGDPAGDEPGPALVQPIAPDPAELAELAAGSPGGLLQHRRQWRALPEGLASRLLAFGADPIEALTLARDLSEELDLPQQLWLIDWLQLALWRRRRRPAELRRLERLRSQLRSHVQPRLAWEVALLQLTASGG
ncbi:MAG: DNA polymerase III subunit delta' [Cyanobium sp.]